MSKFYATKFGIAASLVDAKVHQEIKGAVSGNAPALVAQRLIRDGYIAEDLRSGTNITALATNGTLDQLRSVIESLHQPTERVVPHKSPRHADPSKQHWGRTPVGYVIQPPKGTDLPLLSPAAKAVYDMLRDTPQSAAELARKARSLNPGTVRWAIQMLRQKGLALSQPLAA